MSLNSLFPLTQRIVARQENIFVMFINNCKEQETPLHLQYLRQSGFVTL